MGVFSFSKGNSRIIGGLLVCGMFARGWGELQPISNALLIIPLNDSNNDCFIVIELIGAF